MKSNGSSVPMNRYLIIFTLAISAAIGGPAFGADEQKAQPVSPEELRKQLQNLPPEERAAKIKELRERGRLPGPTNSVLSPEQRAERARQPLVNPNDLRGLTAEQRRAKITEALDKRLAEFREKKAAGKLTEQEERQLMAMENARKRMAESSTNALRPGPLPVPATTNTPKPAPPAPQPKP
jgi:hypothetical protein